MRRIIFGLASLSFILVSLSQAAVGEGHYSASGTNANIIEKPLKRAKLGRKLSRLTMPISELDDKAQKFFDQGISALHGFWIFEAERNFREVILLKPDHPFGYAFAAFAQTVFESGNRTRGLEYLNLAQKKRQAGKVTLSEAEVRWLDAIDALYSVVVKREGDAETGREEELEDEKEAEVRRYKSHIKNLKGVLEVSTNGDFTRETKAFLALSVWVSEIANKKQTEELIARRAEVDQLIEDVLVQIPTHPVHHYKIHLWNNMEDEILARESALRSGKDNADCAHLWHMPSHIFSPLKEFRNAAYQFEAAHRVDNRHLAVDGLNGQVIHNYGHNISYYLGILNNTGGTDRAIAIAKNILAGPQFFQSENEYHDPVNHTVDALIAILEYHQMWGVGVELQTQGYFANIFERDSEREKRAKLLRFVALSYARSGDLKEAKRFRDRIKFFRHNLSLRGADPKLLRTIEEIEMDTTYWLTIGESDQPKSISSKTIAQLKELDITPKHAIARLLFEDGEEAAALELAKEAVAESPSTIAPQATLTLLLLRAGKTEEALGEWDRTKNLLLTPYDQELNAAPSFGAGTAPSLLNQLGLELETKLGQDMEKLTKLFSLPTGGRQHTWKTWVDANGFDREKLGPLMVVQPKAPFGVKFAKQWGQVKQHYQPELERRVGLGSSNEEMVLVVFRQAAGCEMCNAEQEKLLNDYAERFDKLKVQILVVYPEKIDPKVDEHKNVSFAADPELTMFKAFGAYDEFTKTPTHGVFLVGQDSRIRWSERSDHAFKHWKGLYSETERLQRLPLFRAE